jgi:hypothetical protein
MFERTKPNGDGGKSGLARFFVAGERQKLGEERAKAGVIFGVY